MIDIASYSESECEACALAAGESAYRGRQLFAWIRKGASSFDEMTNLPRAFIEKLQNDFFLPGCQTVTIKRSEDGTRKYLFALHDGEKIESVFMKYIHGNTVCVSTQAGCRMGCAFCASTAGGLKRNLLPSEMYAQITEIVKETKEQISNVVLMGMGEPLDNYDHTLAFIRMLNDKKGQNIGFRHISLSTCGMIDKIYRLAEENIPLTLSVSLHAPNGEIRKRLMPAARKYGYDELLAACAHYAEITKRRVSYEYALIAGVNDSVENARELGQRLAGTLCHVNLIPLNETKQKVYKKSAKSHIEAFKKALESYRITVTVRRSLGGDISAACGQLRAESL